MPYGRYEQGGIHPRGYRRFIISVLLPLNVKMNKSGYEDIDKVLTWGTQALDPAAFEQVANAEGALILDASSKRFYTRSYSTINLYCIDGVCPWVGALIADVKQPILLVAPEGREEETVTAFPALVSTIH